MNSKQPPRDSRPGSIHGLGLGPPEPAPPAPPIEGTRPGILSHRCPASENGTCSRLWKRREVLSLAGASAGLIVVPIGVAGCGSPTGSPPTGAVTAGNLSALAVGTMLVMGNVAIARDANGVYAMSAVCTHAGCLLDDGKRTIAAGLSCPCHGSLFSGDGSVLQGPARAALQHYAVLLGADGSITVDGSQPVSASARTPVG